MLRYGVVYYSILKVSEARGRRSYELHCSQYKIQRKWLHRTLVLVDLLMWWTLFCSKHKR